jgi:hypothetical protein
MSMAEQTPWWATAGTYVGALKPDVSIGGQFSGPPSSPESPPPLLDPPLLLLEPPPVSFLTFVSLPLSFGPLLLSPLLDEHP